MEFILTFILILLLVGWVFKRVFPLLLMWYIQRRARQGGGSTYFGGNFNGWSNTQERSTKDQRKEGEVTVEKKSSPKEKVIDRSVGEYVDYEEEK